MATSNIRVLALDLDGTLTNDQKEITPRTRAALERAMDQGVTVVLASGRPTAGVRPVAQELGLDQRGGCILSYNGGAIVDCKTGEIRYQKILPAELVPELCAYGLFAGLFLRLIRTGKLYADLYLAMVPAMLLGRVIAGLVRTVVFLSGAQGYSLALWVSSYFVESFPTMVLQLVVLPTLVVVLMKARLIPERYGAQLRSA